MPFDLSEIANDPDMGQGATIIRTKGSFGLGGWIQSAPSNIPCWGILAPANDEALEQVPEGDRVNGSIQFITQTQIFETSLEQSSISDQIQWNGNLYRVQSVGPWQNFGFYSAILTRKTGA